MKFSSVNWLTTYLCDPVTRSFRRLKVRLLGKVLICDKASVQYEATDDNSVYDATTRLRKLTDDPTGNAFLRPEATANRRTSYVAALGSRDDRSPNSPWISGKSIGQAEGLVREIDRLLRRRCRCWRWIRRRPWIAPATWNGWKDGADPDPTIRTTTVIAVRVTCIVTATIAIYPVKSQRIDVAEWIVTHIRIPVPSLRVGDVHCRQSCRVGRYPASLHRMIPAEQEVIQPARRPLLLPGKVVETEAAAARILLAKRSLVPQVRPSFGLTWG